jgi:hypothetical protein
MRRLAIVPTYNAPGKNDVSGAFVPEAKRWLSFEKPRDRVLVSFDNRASMSERRLEIARALQRLEPGFGSIAFFCHGLWRQLQTGHTTATAGRLAALLAPLLEPQNGRPVSVPLYACDAAEGEVVTPKKGKIAAVRGPGGDGGFADELRDAFLREQWSEHGARLAGGWIDAHVTTGHTTRNPNVRRFDLEPLLPHELVLGMVGGESLIASSARALWRRWRERLQEQDDDLRLRFATMTRAELVAELAT